MNFTFGSVCSGIESASVAWLPLGWEADWFSEIDGFPKEVLRQRFPDVPNFGDMGDLAPLIRCGLLSAPDILVGGTPCQSFSLAGLRESLSDERGQLTLSFVDIANAIDENRERRGIDPGVIVWENVPGVLSSKDNAFGCFIAALSGGDSEARAPGGGRWSNAGYVLGPKRAVAWRVLDAQYFGLAQRRKRVFVIASARDGFCPAKVLFEFDSVRRDNPPSREAGQATAGYVGIGPASASDRDAIGDSCPTLSKDHGEKGSWSSCQGLFGSGSSNQKPTGNIGAGTASARHKDGLVQAGFRMTAFGQYSDDDSASTMKARDYKDATDLVVIHPTDIVGALDTECGGSKLTSQSVANGHILAFGVPGNWIGRKPENGGNSTQFMHEIAPAQTATDKHGVIAFNSRQYPVSGDVFGALDTSSPQAQAITTSYPMHVRRLTPIECERLQGFPDNYTRIPWRGKDVGLCPDIHRYKALGNSMAVPVMRWIGERIKMELSKSGSSQL